MKIWDMQNHRGAAFPGNPFLGNREMDVREKIAARKQLYQKQAMHFVNTANEGEQRIDKCVEDSKERVRRLMDETEEANRALQDILHKTAQAKEDYEVADDSQEQKDLELLRKEYDVKNHRTAERLTEEEEARLAEMGELTEYQSYVMELYGQQAHDTDIIEENNLKMSGENAALRSIKIERLKSQGMLDAQKAKEELMETASKEAVGMLVEDAKEQIDERAEEVKEAAEERKEAKEEEEQRVEAAKENKTEAETAVENTKENVEKLTEQAVKSAEIGSEVSEAVKKILEEEKLLEEELKGIALDVHA